MLQRNESTIGTGLRERVNFWGACSFKTGEAGFELNYRGKMKEPPLLTVPTFRTL